MLFERKLYIIKYNPCIQNAKQVQKQKYVYKAIERQEKQEHIGSGIMDIVKRKAYAKINLGLDVIRKREDGYHEVRMIMQNIGLCDELTFEKQPEGITLKIDRVDLPTDGNNLIYRAARLLKEEYGITEGVRIRLKKQIPIAAGLAGGSTDAAAVFHGMNRLFGLGMSAEKMCELGVRIGADVPYCILGGTALAEGIGEKLTSLPDAPKAIVLLAKPDISVSTKDVYGNLHVEELKVHPDIDGMTKAVIRHDLDGILERMDNVLENVTIRQYPVIDEIKNFMKDQGAFRALMSGSGPTVFGIFERQEQAAAAYLALKKTGLAKDLTVTTFVSPRKEET